MLKIYGDKLIPADFDNLIMDPKRKFLGISLTTVKYCHHMSMDGQPGLNFPCFQGEAGFSYSIQFPATRYLVASILKTLLQHARQCNVRFIENPKLTQWAKDSIKLLESK